MAIAFRVDSSFNTQLLHRYPHYTTMICSRAKISRLNFVLLKLSLGTEVPCRSAGRRSRSSALIHLTFSDLACPIFLPSFLLLLFLHCSVFPFHSGTRMRADKNENINRRPSEIEKNPKIFFLYLEEFFHDLISLERFPLKDKSFSPSALVDRPRKPLARRREGGRCWTLAN